jgi:hypothetical protein
MRLQFGSGQHCMHCTGGQSEFGRQHTYSPAALIIGLLTDTRLRLALLPYRDRLNPQHGGYLPVIRPIGRSQDNAAAKGQRLGRRGGVDELVESATILSAKSLWHGQYIIAPDANRTRPFLLPPLLHGLRRRSPEPQKS